MSDAPKKPEPPIVETWATLKETGLSGDYTWTNLGGGWGVSHNGPLAWDRDWNTYPGPYLMAYLWATRRPVEWETYG